MHRQTHTQCVNFVCPAYGWPRLFLIGTRRAMTPPPGVGRMVGRSFAHMKERCYRYSHCTCSSFMPSMDVVSTHDMLFSGFQKKYANSCVFGNTLCTHMYLIPRVRSVLWHLSSKSCRNVCRIDLVQNTDMCAYPKKRISKVCIMISNSFLQIFDFINTYTK